MIEKINNRDIDSQRLRQNMTDTQKRNDNLAKEGVIINSYVKDPLLSLDETYDSLVISKQKIDLPEKLYEKEKKHANILYPMSAAVVGFMGVISGFTMLMKNFSKGRMDSTKEFLLPGITRNHCINDEIHQSIFSMIQSPNRKTILATIGVVTLASMAFAGKIFIDGFKDVWIKKQEADIQKNLQENLISVEKQSFSGKLQIIRSLLSSKGEFFKNELAFKSRDNETKKQHSNMFLAAFGTITMTAIIGLGYLSVKNIRKSDQYIKTGLKNTKQGLELIIEEFNAGRELKNVEGHNGEKLSDTPAYKYIIENMLESIYAQPQDIEHYIKKMRLENKEKEEFIKHLKESMNQSTEKVNPTIGGSGKNKITYYSHVNDYLSFFYDWLMNPKNPQFKNLFFGIAGISALGYGGKSIAEAVKEVQVKKYNAQTELNLQKRLVSTELRNFKAKKDSAIEPLCDEFLKEKQNGKSKEELKIIADNILFEIKNGPPFVYS